MITLRVIKITTMYYYNLGHLRLLESATTSGIATYDRCVFTETHHLLSQFATGVTTHDSCYKLWLIKRHDYGTHVNIPARKKTSTHYKNIL